MSSVRYVPLQEDSTIQQWGCVYRRNPDDEWFLTEADSKQTAERNIRDLLAASPWAEARVVCRTITITAWRNW